MEQQVTIDKNQQRQGRVVFLLMTIFFAVPMVVVLAMYKFDWKPSGQSHGDLYSPAKLLTHADALQNDHGLAMNEFWGGKWNMVYVADTCDKTCLDKLYLMRQIHVSLYKDFPRAQRVLLTTQNDVKAIKNQYPELVVVNQPKDQVMKFAQQFSMNQEDVVQAHRLYLVDPLGHLVLSYKPDASGAHVRKDLVRLLKYSWAG